MLIESTPTRSWTTVGAFSPTNILQWSRCFSIAIDWPQIDSESTVRADWVIVSSQTSCSWTTSRRHICQLNEDLSSKSTCCANRNSKEDMGDYHKPSYNWSEINPKRSASKCTSKKPLHERAQNPNLIIVYGHYTCLKLNTPKCQ